MEGGTERREKYLRDWKDQHIKIIIRLFQLGAPINNTWDPHKKIVFLKVAGAYAPQVSSCGTATERDCRINLVIARPDSLKSVMVD